MNTPSALRVTRRPDVVPAAVALSSPRRVAAAAEANPFGAHDHPQPVAPVPARPIWPNTTSRIEGSPSHARIECTAARARRAFRDLNVAVALSARGIGADRNGDRDSGPTRA